METRIEKIMRLLHVGRRIALDVAATLDGATSADPFWAGAADHFRKKEADDSGSGRGARTTRLTPSEN